MRYGFAFKGIFVAFSLVFFLFTQMPSMAEELQAAPPAKGLVGHYYGNRGFLLYGGKMAVPSLNMAVDMNTLPWPPRVWEYETKNFQFERNMGWSLAIYGSLRVEAAGEYRFFYDGNDAQVWVDGRVVRTDGKKPIAIKAGSVPLRILMKSSYPLKDWKMALHLRWQGSGNTDPVEIDPSLLSSSEQDIARIKAVTFDIPLPNATMPFVGMRDYSFEVPEDGFYELSMHYKSPPYIPRYCDAFLDGSFLYHYIGGAYRWGFMETRGTVKYLKKGKHTLRISSQTAHFESADMTEFIEGTTMGWNRVQTVNPDLTLSVIEKGRQDMVFKRGEKFVIQIEQATREAVDYTVEVRRQRGGDTVVWSGMAALPADKAHAAAEVTYPCADEGAFEYRVVDAEGQVVEGPWAFVVVDPTPLPNPKAGETGLVTKEILVDQVDCSLADDPEHKFRDNGRSQVVEGPKGKYRVTGKGNRGVRGYVHADDFKEGPPNGNSGPWRVAKEGEKPLITYHMQDWFAYTLKVKNPGKAHKVTAWIPTDVRRQVSVWGFDPVTAFSNGAEMLAGDAPRSEALVPLSFLMWPNTDYVDIISVCTDGCHNDKENRQGAIAKIELYELPDGLPPLPEAAGGWAPDKEFGWSGEQIDIGMEQRMMPKFWDDADWVPAHLNGNVAWAGGYYDWKALSTVWERVGQYCRYRGHNLLVWPVYDYTFDMLRTDHLPKRGEAYSRGWKYRLADRMRKDQLKMILLMCEKYHVKFVADFMIQTISKDNVLATDTEHKWSDDGLFLTGQDGKVVTYPATVLNPAHPLCRKYLIDMCGEIARKYGASPAFGGINIRQWNGWHTNNSGWFFNSRHGYDDFTIGVFEKETGVKIPVEQADADRFKKRRDYLLDKERQKWFRWRSDKVFSLREEMLAEMRKYAPQIQLYGGFKPSFDEGRGLDDAQLAGRRDLGFGKVDTFGGFASEYNVADPIEYEKFDMREPKSLRRDPKMLSGREIGYPNSFCSGWGTIRCPPYQLEDPSRSLAKNPMETVIYGAQWILPPMDDGIRSWAQAWRAIPVLSYERLGGKSFEKEPVQCWSAGTSKSIMGLWKKNGVVFYLVNTTPMERSVSVAFDDEAASVTNLVSGKKEDGVRKIEVSIKPFMLEVFAAEGVSKVKSVRIAQQEIDLKTSSYAPVSKGVADARIEVPGFVIDKFEVTNSMFELFKPERKKERNPAAPSDNSPVVDVSWYDAIAYCNWRSQLKKLQPCYDLKTGSCDFTKNGYRLPTELEWERAAAGPEGRPYSWGSAAPSEGLTYRCRYGDYDVPQRAVPNANPLFRVLDGFKFTAPVGSFENFATPEGVCDLAGNVWEWCQDPHRPGGKSLWRALRGGSWRSDLAGIRNDARNGAAPETRDNHIGFRCVRNGSSKTLTPLAASVSGAVRAPWLVEDREWRIQVVLKERKGAARANEVVVISGRHFLDLAPGAKIRTSSIRIMRSQEFVPCQVDEKDGTGDFVPKPNGILDMDDEICFQVSLPAGGEQVVSAYFSTNDKPKTETATDLSSAVVGERTNKEPYNLLLKNSRIEVGISGPAVEGKQDWQKWRTGAISHLKAGEINMLPIFPNTGLPASTWPAVPVMPEIVASGPVRLIGKVRFEKTNLEWFLNANFAFDGNLKGAVKNYYYQIAANSPVIEFVDDLRYGEDKAGTYREWWQYMNVFPGGGGCHAEQIVCYSQDEQPKQEKLADMAARYFEDGKLSRHFGYDASDGWAAVLDPKNKNGFAFIGAPGINKMVVQYHKGTSFGVGYYGSIFQNLFINDKLANDGNRQLRRYWMVVLGDEDLAGAMNWRQAFLYPLEVRLEQCEKQNVP